MKHCLLLLAGFCLLSLVSCQKKQYAYFQNSPQAQYAHNTKKVVSPTADVTTTQADEITLPSALTESFSASNAETTIIESTTAVAEKTESLENKATTSKATVKKKMSFVQKVKAVSQLRKLSKQVSKKSATAANPKGNPDTLALIAMVAGIAGIVLLWALPGLGLLLGLGALILGAVSLRNTNKRGMAITGIILGALSILIGLLLVIFVAALFAAAL